VNKERITIGRRPNNDIHVDNLAVSGEHAVVTTLLNDSFLEDMDSTNGTLVNGQPVKKHYLQDGDVIEIGKFKLVYDAEAAASHAAAEEQDFDRTMIIRSPRPPEAAPHPDHDTTQPMTRYEEVHTDAPPPPAPAAPKVSDGLPLAAIQVLTGANAGKELELAKTLTSLGKPGVQVAVITRRPQGYFITHVQGDSFPVVNGQRLDAQAHPLHDHDVIDLAGIKMEFFFK
jgi:pSer/pThr/pTyr-binding forkhead associated (FHA) protein